jgi:D-glycero-alpha-D-manno-heptose-7-phosphate kinase
MSQPAYDHMARRLKGGPRQWWSSCSPRPVPIVTATSRNRLSSRIWTVWSFSNEHGAEGEVFRAEAHSCEARAVIITQTPLRIGLAGGCSDLPDYYIEHGGRVLSCAINKYVYVIVKQRFDDAISVNYPRCQTVSDVRHLEHELVREAMLMTGISGGVEITMLSDVPSGGCGLGSSSSITVGLVHALLAFQQQYVPAEELAERACTIEIERCGKRVGKQDQYIAALGGIQDFHFGPGDKVVATELGLSGSERRRLEDQLMLFFTGVTRSATEILAEQSNNVGARLDWFHELRDLAGAAVEHVKHGDLHATGKIVQQSWEAKRRLADGVTNSQIDSLVDTALEAGATGAKITGAGGGGFLLVIAPLEKQERVRQSLAHLREFPLKLERFGSRVVVNFVHDIWS